MTKPIVALLACFASITAFGQTTNIWKQKPWEKVHIDGRKLFTPPANQSPVQPNVANNPSNAWVLPLALSIKKTEAVSATADAYVVDRYHMPGITPNPHNMPYMPAAGIKPKEKEGTGEK